MKYKVYGTLEYNWDYTVEADSESEAERLAVGYAEDGMANLSDLVDTPEIHAVEEVG